MKIYNKIVYDFDNNIIEEDYYEYEGPITLAEAAGPSGGSGGGGGRAERDKAARDKAAREEKEMTAEFDRIDKETAERAAKNREDSRGGGQLNTSKNVTDGTLSDPRETNDTAAKQSIKDSKKTTTTYGGGNGGGNGGDNNNTITQVTQTAPTIAEVDQVTTDTTPTETAKTTEANRLLKIKKKGRSRSIMTSAKGVTKTSSDYSLGKPSLLGRV